MRCLFLLSVRIWNNSVWDSGIGTFLQDSPMECGMVDKYAKSQHYNGDMYSSTLVWMLQEHFTIKPHQEG